MGRESFIIPLLRSISYGPSLHYNFVFLEVRLEKRITGSSIVYIVEKKTPAPFL